MSSLYLAVPELAAAPVGIAWDQVAGEFNTTAAKIQQWYCQNASGLIDNYCGAEVYGPTRPYVLRATLDTEVAVTDTKEQTFIDNHGNLVFIARYKPILNVVSGNYIPVSGAGQTGGTPAPFSMTDVFWDGQQITHLGPFELYEFNPLRVSVTYIDGFPNAVLTAPATANDVSLAVDDLTGIMPGQELTIFDMPPETIFVSASFVPARGPGNLPLLAGLLDDHVVGTRVSALGADAQQAALYLVQDLVQSKAVSGALAAWAQLGERAVPMGPTDYAGRAKELLNNYRLSPGI